MKKSAMQITKRRMAWFVASIAGLQLLLIVLGSASTNEESHERISSSSKLYHTPYHPERTRKLDQEGWGNHDLAMTATKPNIPHIVSRNRVPGGFNKLREFDREEQDWEDTNNDDEEEEEEETESSGEYNAGGAFFDLDISQDEEAIQEYIENTEVISDDAPWDLAPDTPDAEEDPPLLAEAQTGAPFFPGPEDEIADAFVEEEPYVTDTFVEEEPYVAIVIEDDVPWDDAFEREYVEEQIEAMERLNSNSSAADDDELDDEFPTLSPTAKPMGTIGPTSSSQPTGQPSVAPTDYPTPSPSEYPSNLPTDGPSQEPSASPTHFCHDDLRYRSPINGLQCSQHRSTNCLAWRYVGLNMTELETLIKSCPITCQVECGSFELFKAPVSFRISRVSGYMDPKDVDLLLEFSIEYLERFIRSFIGSKKAIFTTKEKEIEEAADEKDTEKVDSRIFGTTAAGFEAEALVQVKEDDYLNDDVVETGVTMFDIDSAELTSQNLVEDILEMIGRTEIQEKKDGGRKGGALRWRNLQDLQRTKEKSLGGASIVKTDEALDVVITFDGFTIGMNPERMSDLLVLGIDSVDFTRALQQSRIAFFSEATVSSAMTTEEDDHSLFEEELEENETESNSRFTNVIFYLVPTVVIGFALGSLFYHKVYGKGRKSKNYNNHMVQIGGLSTTPMPAGDSNSIAESNDEGDDGRYFNFRQNSTSYQTDEENENANALRVKSSMDSDEKPGQSAFSRFISSLNLNLTLTKSKNSTDDEDDDYRAEENLPDDTSSSESSDALPDKEETKQRGDGISVIDDALVSPISGDSESDNEMATPPRQLLNQSYASVLPPMIVIDNIDESGIVARSPVARVTSEGSNAAIASSIRSSNRSSNNQIEDLDAFASDFRKQLLNSSTNAINAQHHSYSGSFYGSFTSNNADEEEEDDDSRVIRGMVSDDWEDDLFSPIPSNITTNEDGDENNRDMSVPKTKRSASFDDEDSLKSPRTSSGEPKIKDQRKFGTWDGSPSTSEVGAGLRTDMPSSAILSALHRGTKSDVPLPKVRPVLPPKRPPTPERGSSSFRKHDKGPNGHEHQRRSSFPKSMSNLSFNARSLVGSSSGSMEAEGHRRKSSVDTTPGLTKNSSSISALSTGTSGTDDLAIANSRSDGSHQNISQTNRLEFEAPREGNWGLVLESSSKTGPRIYAVKDYSPLFGLVQKGDKLLEVDGKNVSRSNLTEVTKILKGKSSSYGYHRHTSTTMPIVISRTTFPSIESSSATAALANSNDYNNARHLRHPQYGSGDYSHKRNNSHGSGGSSGSRVVEDLDDENSGVYYLDRQHPNQYALHTSVDYDSSNEI